MAVSRIQIASNKKSALSKQNKREIAVMLSEVPPKEEKAKIRAEALVRDDNLIEAYEILQLECELLHERIKLIEYEKTCPRDLVSVVSTLIWAAHRVDIPELLLIRKQFRAKYGKQFEDDALANAGSVLNERVVMKLSVDPPPAYIVQSYLERICEEFEVDWTPRVKLSTNELIEPMAAPVGYSVQIAQGSGLGTAVTASMPVATVMGGDFNDATKENHTDLPVVTAKPFVPNQGGGSSAASTGGKGDFDEVDIYVPGAPTAPLGGSSTPTSGVTAPTTMATDQPSSNDDDNDESPAPAGGSGAASGTNGMSYQDLAARFDKLTK